jgi:uncharacterized protein
VDETVQRHAVEYLGADRCLFGTDGPSGPAADDGMFDNGLITRRIESLYQDKSVQWRLFGENFQELTGV